MRTILQATAQVPDANIVYGPDTYMGTNIKKLFETLAKGTDEQVQKLHPAHTVASVKKLVED